MTLDHGKVRKMAEAYTAAWNSGSPEAVAAFYALDGEILINSGTKKPLRVIGWEEWDLDADLKVSASRGWYDADDYARQTANL